MRKVFSSPRRASLITAIILIAASLTTVGFVGTASATPKHDAHRGSFPCGLATLTGTYLFHGDGTNVLNGVETPLSYAGSITFDGNGNLHGYVTTDGDGQVQSDRPYTGTYTLGSNCTGNYTIDSTVHVPVSFDMFVAPTGNYYTYVQTQPVGAVFDVDATSAQRVSLG